LSCIKSIRGYVADGQGRVYLRDGSLSCIKSIRGYVADGQGRVCLRDGSLSCIKSIRGYVADGRGGVCLRGISRRACDRIGRVARGLTHSVRCIFDRVRGMRNGMPGIIKQAHGRLHQIVGHCPSQALQDHHLCFGDARCCRPEDEPECQKTGAGTVMAVTGTQLIV
jgi:hypothetical protein